MPRKRKEGGEGGTLVSAKETPPKRLPSARLNFTFKVVCVDCGTVFDVGDALVSPTVNVLENRNRLVMVTIPNYCPECHNVRVVG